MLATLLAMLTTAGLPGAPAAAVAPAATGPDTRCCFTNQDHVGVCVVIPGERETCKTILTYLNTPNTVARTYCNSTRIRGGWKQVPCPPSSPPAASSSAAATASTPCPALPPPRRQ